MGKYVKSKDSWSRSASAQTPRTRLDGGPDYNSLDQDDCELVQVVHSSALEKMFATSPRLNQIGTMFKSGHCDLLAQLWSPSARLQTAGLQLA
ncbi:hypothetical protein HDE_02035 [Halotydeus destructor]|nr:hypothetical protein HDE_02035 [Halotydeus destructor]